MKRLSLYVVIPLLFALSSCAKPASRMASLSPGMTKDEVIRTMGSPTGVEYKGGTEHLYYMVTEWPLDFTAVEYEVVLVNGEVVSFGRQGGDFEY